MADEEFRRTGLSPAYAFLMMLVNDNPVIGRKELCEHLHLAPSTVTWFVDALVYRGFLTRRTDGKAAKVYATEAGAKLRKTHRGRLEKSPPPLSSLWRGGCIRARTSSPSRHPQPRTCIGKREGG